MEEGKSLINFGELSKPATVLIEKISEAVGGYFKPYQIKRIAKAEAEANIITAQSEIEISDLHRRAFNRFVAEEAKKQENIESITQKAIPQLTDSSAPENIENDWITNFFDKCRIISDGEMQMLWGKVLAGEANAPGSYSKRTVNFLSSLDMIDANLFSSLCSFGWIIGNLTPLIYDVQEPIYNNAGINFNTLTHLDDIGLISFNSVAGFKRIQLPKAFVVLYYGTPVLVNFEKEMNNELNSGNVLLTNIGQQLANICGSKPIDGFQDYVIKRWSTQGLIVKILKQ